MPEFPRTPLPLAGRGQIARKRNPAEGESPRIRLSPLLWKQPLTPTLSPQRAGRRNLSRARMEGGSHV
ncbi:hypothetical protein J2R80_003819 [Bradyrhizobium sp. USDA 4541]|nr:hypothetical protein [Bradyrhizobium sp. USDA 4541]